MQTEMQTDIMTIREVAKTVGVRSCILQANRCGDLGQRVAMSIARRRHPGAAIGMPVSDRRKIQDLTPNVDKT